MACSEARHQDMARSIVGQTSGKRRDQVREQGLWRGSRARRRVPQCRRRRVRLAARPLRLRQDHAARHSRRLHPAVVRLDPLRRPRRHLHAAAQARHRRRVPELRAVSAHERRRERRLSVARAPAAESELAGQGARGARDGRPCRLRGARHRAALRRPAPARGAGARHDLRAAPDPDGRAAFRARQAAARIHADRAARRCTSASAPPSSTSPTTSARR